MTGAEGRVEFEVVHVVEEGGPNGEEDVLKTNNRGKDGMLCRCE